MDPVYCGSSSQVEYSVQEDFMGNVSVLLELWSHLENWPIGFDTLSGAETLIICCLHSIKSRN